MNILYIGDIMGEPGIAVVEKVLPGLRKKHHLDLVIAQAENLSGGKGTLPADIERMKRSGVDFFTGGNHTFDRPQLRQLLEDNNVPVIGPANMPACPGRGWKYIRTAKGDVLVISMLGDTFGAVKPEIENPLNYIDTILDENKGKQRVATIVNIHGDYSSQKVVYGYYLDGRVSAVIGDHWHVPTADAAVLPKGTAHISDVGACCAVHSSLGIKLETITARWRDGTTKKFELEDKGPFQFCAVLITTDDSTGLARSIEQVITHVD